MNDKVLVKQILLSTNYWSLNKDVVRMFGLEAAFILSNLAEAEKMMADESGWFYQTGDTLENISGLSRYRQDQAIQIFIEKGILEKDLRGIPAKRYFRFNDKKLANKIANNLKTSVKEISKLDSKKFETNKESTINKVNKESNSPAKAEQIPYKVIIDYLNEKADRSFKHTASGNQKVIKARWNEGYDENDFKKVIDIKVSHANDPKHWFEEEYLRPATLFSQKFDQYLNETPSWKGKGAKDEPTTDFNDLSSLLGAGE